MDCSEEKVTLAGELFARWDQGRGVSKSQLEIETWSDATSHGRHFDRFVNSHLGVSTSKPSKQTDRIADLERQVKGLGASPVGYIEKPWEVQVRHARESCLAAIRIWNDPTSRFRTASFSLLFVAAWNGIAISLLQRAGEEWTKVDGNRQPILRKRVEQALGTSELINRALPGAGTSQSALRANVDFWIDLRNCVAHRYLPEVDLPVIPQAQAGLLNIESVLSNFFGPEYAIAESLSVPLQLPVFGTRAYSPQERRSRPDCPLMSSQY